jgi:acyl dehydratase
MLGDSTFTLALLTGISVRTVSAKVVANLGWDKVKATHPVFAGDSLLCRIHGVVEARLKESAHAGDRYRFHSRIESGY